MVHLQDFNDPPPSRKPWVILAIVILLIVFAGWRIVKARSSSSVTTLPVPASTTNAPAATVVATPVPVPTDTSATSRVSIALPLAELDEAAALEKAGSRVEAREKYLQILEKHPGAPGIEAVEEKAGALGIELLMKPYPMPEKEDYVVASGDTLDKIARKFDTTKELLITNNLIAKPSLIKSGDHFRVFKGAFKVKINKTRCDLLVTMNDRFFKRYRVGTGKFGKTPVGTFVIGERSAQPVWWKPDGKEVPFGDPANILGTHWLRLKASGNTLPVKGYGIHGTWDDASIGKAESAGCVRLHNPDVEQLYVMLPIGTEVVIEE
jgi:LysM repeat protein